MFKILEFTIWMLSRSWNRYLGLWAVYSLVVAFFASVIFFISALRFETQVVLSDLPEIWVQRIAGGRLVPMPGAMVDSLHFMRGVKRIYPRVWGYNFDTPTGAVFTIIGSDSLTGDLEYVQTLSEKALGPEEALTGTGFLELRGLQVGEKLTLLNDSGAIRSYSIVGSFAPESDLLSKDLIVLSPKAARGMLGLKPHEITDVGIEVFNPAEVNNIARKIDRRFAGVRVVTASQLRNTYETLFGWRGGIFLYGALPAVLAFLILAIERTSGLNRENRRELGILKANGWQIRDVLLFKLWENLLISGMATLSGMLIAYGHVFWLGAPILRPFLVGWSVLYPQYNLVPYLDGGSLLLIVMLSVVPYLSAGLYPAWRGAITDPADIMRNG